MGQRGKLPKASSCVTVKYGGKEKGEVKCFSYSLALKKRETGHILALPAVCPILLVSEHQDGLSKIENPMYCQLLN